MTAAFSPEEINIRWGEAFNAADIPALLELYEPGAVLIPAPGAEPVSGLDAIEASLRWLAGTGGKLTYQPRFWLQNGDLAMGRIDFRLSGGAGPDGSPIDLAGGTAEVARRQPDGTWKYVFDHPFGASPA
jgi:ketosteroid isomerase-like protein